VDAFKGLGLAELF